MQLVHRRIFYIFIILAGLFWLFFSRSKAISQSGHILSPAVGFYPPTFSLETVIGDSISLDDYSGVPVIINFWASWCPPCRAEMPALQAVYSEYYDQVMILAVNAADQDQLSAVKNMQSDFGLEFPILMDNDGSVQQAYQISSLPTTFFIAPNGQINEIKIGGPLTETSLRIWIEQNLQEIP